MKLLRQGCYYFSFLLLLSVFNTFGQNQPKADSIRNVLDTKQLRDEERLEAFYWLSIYSSSPSERLDFGTRLLSHAEDSENEEYIIKGNYRVGVAYRFLGDLVRAQEFLFKSADGAIKNENLRPYLAEVYAEISICYTQNGDSENALLYNSKAINILRTTDRRQELAISLLNTGFDYYVIGKYDSSMAYYNESEPILKDIGLEIGLAYIMGNRALVFWKEGDLQRAKQDLFTAIEMLRPIGDQFGMADYYNQLGNIFLEENMHDQAILYTTKGLEMSRAEGLKEQVRDASNLLYLIYQEKGDYKNALNYLTQYHAYKDSIQNVETTQQLANLRTEFEVGQKQVEVDLLLEQKRSNQIIIITGGIILAVVICLVIVVYFYFKSKNRLSKQLEEQKNALLVLNQTKDKFFSIISHDLRGPVNALSGLVNVTKYFIKDGKNNELSDIVGKMEISIDRLVKLLDNLLTWALQQQGHFPYVPENLNLKDTLVEVVDMFKDMAISKDIELDYNITDDIHLFTDKNSTSTILRNLINNAIKFTPEGGQVQVYAETDTEQNIGLVRVIDNGVGIPKEKLDNLFKLNEKISTRGTSGETGLGLGLQLVFEFVELNNGKIAVESEPNKGTTFTVQLPLN